MMTSTLKIAHKGLYQLVYHNIDDYDYEVKQHYEKMKIIILQNYLIYLEHIHNEHSSERPADADNPDEPQSELKTVREMLCIYKCNNMVR